MVMDDKSAINAAARDEALRELAALRAESERDRETAHVRADGVLIDFLRKIGYSDIADEFDAIPKWYA